MNDDITVHIPIKVLDSKAFAWLIDEANQNVRTKLWIREVSRDVPTDWVSRLNEKFEFELKEEQFEKTLSNIYRDNTSPYGLIVGLGDVIQDQLFGQLRLESDIVLLNYAVEDTKSAGGVRVENAKDLFKGSSLMLHHVFSFIGNVIFSNKAGRLIAERLPGEQGPPGHRHSITILRMVMRGDISFAVQPVTIVIAMSMFGDTFRTGSALDRLLLDYKYIAYVREEFPPVGKKIIMPWRRELKCLLYDIYCHNAIRSVLRAQGNNVLPPTSLLYWVKKCT